MTEETCNLITLAYSGCRKAMMIHSCTSTETIDKMADLVLCGYAQNLEQDKRMRRMLARESRLKKTSAAGYRALRRRLHG